MSRICTSMSGYNLFVLCQNQIKLSDRALENESKLEKPRIRYLDKFIISKHALEFVHFAFYDSGHGLDRNCSPTKYFRLFSAASCDAKSIEQRGIKT